jgi:hypothetical protein
MDSTLIGITVILVCAVVIGMALAFIGLAYHHHRRHHELFGARDLHDIGSRLPTP